jgi:hypothetical protein
MPAQSTVLVRRGTRAEWIVANPVLKSGEFGLDTTTGKYKIGDGLTAWNSLLYSSILPNSDNLIGASGVGIVFSAITGTPVTISVTGILSSQINDFNSAVDARITNISISEEQIQDIIASGDHINNGFLRNGTGIVLDYNDSNNFLTINVSGYALSNHSHFWNDISDASSIVTTGELAYLSGVVAGTAGADRAVVLDSNKNITGIGNISTTGNITVGGDLVVHGNTTTVNSTTVNIGDNIIRVNTSGLNTGGFEVYTGLDTKDLVWNISNNRWEFSGGNVYTSGDFISNNLQISSTGLVNNLNSDLLDNQHGSYYRNFASLTGLPDPVITGNLTGDIVGSGSVTLNDLGNGVLNIITTLADNVVTSSKIVNGTIVNEDINNSAAIAVTKLASSGVTLGSTIINLGQTSTIIDGLTRISGVSALNPTYIYYAVIDGGSP